MKKFIIALCILFLCTGGVAGAFEFGEKSTNIQTNMNVISTKNTNANFNKNFNINDNSNSSSIVVEGDQRELLAAPQIAPFDIPVYQLGRIGDYTSQMYNFANMTKLSTADVIVKVLGVYNGSWASRIRLEDLEVALLEKRAKLDEVIQEKKVDVAKVRYGVKYKDAVSSGGMGGGAAGSLSFDGLSSATGSVLPGYHSSTHNPQFIITFYEVK